MRDIVLTGLILGALPFILKRPQLGVMMYVWISVMNPHRYTWSFAYDFNFAMIVAIVTLLSVAEFYSSPLGVRANQASPTEAHRWLSYQPAGTVVVEMPVPKNEALWLYETTYLIRSMHHWQPLVNGYSGFAPQEYMRTLETLRGFPDDRSIQRLRELKVRFILLNRVSYSGEEFTDLIARLTGSPAFWPSQSFGDGDDQIIIVELKGAAPPP